MTTESGRYFPVRCPECDHVTYFDKGVVCGKRGRVYRGPKRDEVLLTCESCGEEMTQRVDCEGYR